MAKSLLSIVTVLAILASCSVADLATEPQIYDDAPKPTYTDDVMVTTQPLPSRDPIIITSQQAEEMMSQEGIIILDVRTQQEFASGHIPYATLLPYTEISTLASTIILDKGQTILVYCQRGRRSNIAAWALAEMGFTAVYDFGGIEDWHGSVTTP